MGLCRDQVYNADESGLNFKALPTKTLASLSEKYAPGFKMQKERVTVMVCANASGIHRLPLLVIGKAKRPRCFKGMNMNALPVRYCGQKSAWMEQEIFAEWFKKVFIPLVRQELKSKNLPPKAVLLLDNAPTHPEAGSLQSDDGNIKCIFLPANTTSSVQPMDQSVIETFKRRYRKKFIEALVTEETVSIIEYWKAYNMKNVVYNTADAWDEVSEETLKRSWNKLWPESTDEIATETVERDDVTNEVLAQSAVAFGLDDQRELNE
ncbi:jerky protein homolog-like, partial [Sitodiplosis mosellana]|uniref:jerky protein homolog-like n=1 Tax=Sitodiplosis mosellana TaxID=263140 RepID=UPI002443EDF1